MNADGKNEYLWAQICIIHDRGYAIIGNRYQVTSTSQDIPKLNPRVPVVDVRGVPATKWQAVLHDYSYASEIQDIEFLIEDLEALKEKHEQKTEEEMQSNEQDEVQD